MGTCGRLATVLDQEMLEVVRSVPIAARAFEIEDLPRKTGQAVAEELGGRYLIRYLLPDQVGRYTDGSRDKHWVTPTPYSHEEAIRWLYLPKPTVPRPFAIMLDPNKIELNSSKDHTGLPWGLESNTSCHKAFPKKRLWAAGRWRSHENGCRKAGTSG